MQKYYLKPNNQLPIDFTNSDHPGTYNIITNKCLDDEESCSGCCLISIRCSRYDAIDMITSTWPELITLQPEIFI